MLTYEICDNEDGTRCYAKCATATMNLTVGCPGGRSLLLDKTNDDAGCTPALSTGSINATVSEVAASGSTTFSESFTGSGEGSLSGGSTQPDGQESVWSARELTQGTSGSGGVTSRGLSNRFFGVPVGGEYELDFSVVAQSGATEVELALTLGAPNASGRIDATVQIGRVDANGVFLALNGAGFTYSGVRSSNDRHIERLTLSDVNAIGSTDGRYTVTVTGFEPGYVCCGFTC